MATEDRVEGMNAFLEKRKLGVSRRAVSRLGVVGAGTMGAGIAQLGCAAGHRTLLHDPVPEALERGAAARPARASQVGREGALGEEAAAGCSSRSRSSTTWRPASS